MTGHLIVSDEEATRVITLRRPEKKNAITQDMYRAMSDAVDKAQNNLISAASSSPAAPACSPRGFPERQHFHTDAPRASNRAKFLYSLAHKVKPIIAAVDGVAIGIGTTMLFHLFGERMRSREAVAAFKAFFARKKG